MPIYNGGGGGSGGGIIYETDPNSLHLTGGTLTGNVTANNAQFIASDGIVSEFGDTQERVFINYDSITLNNLNGDFNATVIYRGAISMHNDGTGWNANYNANGFNINGQLIWGEESGLVVSSAGITFADETTQTTAAVDLSQGGSITGNLNINYPAFQFNQEDGCLYIGGYTGYIDAGGFWFNWGLPTYWSIYDGVITFPDSTTQSTAAVNPVASVGNSGLTQSGNIAHSEYPKEIEIVINGTSYLVPARLA